MLHIRPASVEHVPLLLEMILEFATFEKLREEVTITEAMLERDGFGSQPLFRTLIAEWNHAAAGYAICFPIYSTFQGPALFLEDVYVRAQFRDKRNRQGDDWRGCGDGSAGRMWSAALGGACLEPTGHRFLQTAGGDLSR
ncbi:MAG TPA: hypothetical protein VFE61_04070 [Candidatus Sulfotelmatobacter sp.]|nr:hypothetical protein [Candidatus Sulfotelmatobacter sp.]